MLLILPQALNVAIFNVIMTSCQHRTVLAGASIVNSGIIRIHEHKKANSATKSTAALLCNRAFHSRLIVKMEKDINQTVLLRLFVILLHFKQYRSAKHKHSAAVGPSKIHPEVLETFPSIPGSAECFHFYSRPNCCRKKSCCSCRVIT